MTDTVKTANDVEPLVVQERSSALLTVIFLCFSGMSVALMQTLVIPIQSELPQILNTSAANASWVVTITLLGAAVAMPIAGRLGDLFGKQRVLVGSSVLLLAGSLVCALSDSLVPVVAGRGLQGLAMGFIPVGISLMREVVPPAMATTAVAAMSATLGVGGAIGLPLSAWIVQTGDWHTLFWVATGLAVLVGLGSWLHRAARARRPRGHLRLRRCRRPGGRPDRPPRRHHQGQHLGLDLRPHARQHRARRRGPAGVGLVRAAPEQPLCDLRVTARRPVLLTNIAALAIGFGMMAQAIVFPQLLQLPEEIGGLDQTLLAAGLWMAPGGLMMLAFAPVASYLMRTFGAKYALALGAGVLGCGYLLSFFLMSAPWQVLVASLICSAGVGIGYAAMPTLIMDAVPMNEAGSAVGINALMRSVGTTVAAAVMAAILTARPARRPGSRPRVRSRPASWWPRSPRSPGGLALTIPKAERPTV